MYTALVVPTSTILGEPNTWKVNVYDETGDFVCVTGTARRTLNGVTFTDEAGWSTDFDSIQDLSRSVMEADVVIEPRSLN
jgi:hypothetical protein